MGKIAFLFPGQGAQYGGMGRELYEYSAAAREVFACADRLRPGTGAQCFSGTAEELARTENTQPCLYCTELAAAAALREAGVRADLLAGFSVGEIAALAFSGAVTAEQGFDLVCRRAALMQQATQQAHTSMLAVLKLEDGAVAALCREFRRVYPVNFNCPGQIVVSGQKEELEPFKLRVRELGGKALPLRVGGGFHSPFMAGAAEQFRAVLDRFEFAAPSVPLYSNVTALPYPGGGIRELLEEQMCSPVRWSGTVAHMVAAGADTFIEMGPGRVLSGFVSRIAPDAQICGVEDRESLAKTIREVGTDA